MSMNFFVAAAGFFATVAALAGGRGVFFATSVGRDVDGMALAGAEGTGGAGGAEVGSESVGDGDGPETEAVAVGSSPPLLVTLRIMLMCFACPASNC